MKIEIDEKSGFCFGVVNAIRKAEEALREDEEVYCIGDIVHNRVEVSRLRSLGLITVRHEELPALRGKTVLIRAHGEPPATYALLRSNGTKLIDATCPVVSALQQRVKTAYESIRESGGQVAILGKKGHAEVVGLTGQVKEQAIVIEKKEDLDLLDFSRPICLLSQTTQSLDLFRQIKEEIRSRAKTVQDITIHDTICRQVSNREPHLREFAARYDVILFVSGKKSSNGKALFEACLQTNPRSYKIEEENELEPRWFENCRSVGICGATSTPKWLMERIAKAIPLAALPE